MEENQLKVLEERINNAISFIEKLKSREKVLLDEKEGIERRAAELEEQLGQRDAQIEALRENQLFLKGKIETILDKLESLANLEKDEEETSGETGAEPGEFRIPRAFPDESESEDPGSESPSEPGGEIIVEENFVDLRDERDENGKIGDADEPGRGANQREDEEGNLFSADQKEEDEEDRPESDAPGLRGGFDNPFIEM